MDQPALDVIAKLVTLDRIAIAVLILWSGYKQYWVWGREKTEALQENAALRLDRDMWRDRYLKDFDEVRREVWQRVGARTL